MRLETAINATTLNTQVRGFGQNASGLLSQTLRNYGVGLCKNDISDFLLPMKMQTSVTMKNGAH